MPDTGSALCERYKNISCMLRNGIHKKRVNCLTSKEVSYIKTGTSKSASRLEPEHKQQQIPRTASRAPENQGKSKSARNCARDDSWVDMRKGGATFKNEKPKTPTRTQAYTSCPQLRRASLVGRKTGSLSSSVRASRMTAYSKQDAGLKAPALHSNLRRSRSRLLDSRAFRDDIVKQEKAVGGVGILRGGAHVAYDFAR
jgi:hypothetical protein